MKKETRNILALLGGLWFGFTVIALFMANFFTGILDGTLTQFFLALNVCLLPSWILFLIVIISRMKDKK